ncbi:hypothetical protein ON010_g9734 [Phytophthora cinnamomi]|nr:hypothetical protein ON010_g9734 [Phytophthora cinnamomi]
MTQKQISTSLTLALADTYAKAGLHPSTATGARAQPRGGHQRAQLFGRHKFPECFTARGATAAAATPEAGRRAGDVQGESEGARHARQRPRSSSTSGSQTPPRARVRRLPAPARLRGRRAARAPAAQNAVQRCSRRRDTEPSQRAKRQRDQTQRFASPGIVLVAAFSCGEDDLMPSSSALAKLQRLQRQPPRNGRLLQFRTESGRQLEKLADRAAPNSPLLLFVVGIGCAGGTGGAVGKSAAL